MLKISENNGTEEIGLVTPTPKLGESIIPEEVKADIYWWLIFLPFYNGVSLIPERFWANPDSSISCDACITGVAGLVPGEIYPYHIPPVYSGTEYAYKRLRDVDPDICSEDVG